MRDAQQIAKSEVKLPAWVTQAALVATAVGVVGTAAMLLGGRSQETYWMLLVNFVYWVGIAQGVFVWSAIFRTAQATWTPAANRLGHSTLWFLWLAIPLFLLLWSGAEQWLPWLHQTPHGKEAWLNPTFFFWRTLGILVVMAGMSTLLVAWYRKGEEAVGEQSVRRWHARVNRLSVALVIAYAWLYSILAFDLIMSLDPHWFSSLLGGYYFVSNLYLSMAVLILMAVALRRPLGLAHLLSNRQLRDMGNLALGFSLLTTGFFFAQYLTIWYGNLPEETRFLIPRSGDSPWHPFAASLLGIYLGPFTALCFPGVKRDPRFLAPVAAFICLGILVERWVLVVPTLSPGHVVGLSPLYWPIPIGFLGILTLVVTTSLRRQPGVSSMDLSLELSEGVAL